MKPLTIQRWSLALGVVVTLCAVGWWYLLRPNPERVAHQALVALEAKDTDTLCRLTDPEEMKKLHLTPATVDKILRETVWSTEFVQTHHHLMDERISAYPDVKGYGTYPRHTVVQPPNSLRPHDFWLISIQNPDGSWHLNMGRLLVTACYSTGRKDAFRLYYNYTNECGIDGSRSEDGTYLSMADLRKTLRRQYPKEASNWPR